MSDCVFCDIVAGTSPASFVYRDERTCAFMDLATLNQGQVVVIPNNHAANLKELKEDDAESLMRTALRVAEAMRTSSIPCDGLNLFLADSTAAGQEIFHVHFLIIPRLKNDSMKIMGNWINPSREELDATASLLREMFS